MSGEVAVLPEIIFEDFAKVDIRLGKVLEAGLLEKARIPAYRLKIDFGETIGVKQSSARITEVYQPEALPGRYVLAVVNFPARRIAGFLSEVLVLGLYSDQGRGPVILIGPDESEFLKPGDRLG